MVIHIGLQTIRCVRALSGPGAHFGTTARICRGRCTSIPRLERYPASSGAVSASVDGMAQSCRPCALIGGMGGLEVVAWAPTPSAAPSIGSGLAGVGVPPPSARPQRDSPASFPLACGLCIAKQKRGALRVLHIRPGPAGRAAARPWAAARTAPALSVAIEAAEVCGAPRSTPSGATPWSPSALSPRRRTAFSTGPSAR